jgi:hypothetical protein
MIRSRSKTSVFWKSLSLMTPFMAIVFLVGAGVIQTNASVPSEGLGKYHEDIARQISEFPFQIGTWVGQDVVIPTSAQEILNPNGLVSRRFSRYGAQGSLTFALIHCIDLRDMHGHHPPRCYPASGWSFLQGDVGVDEGALAEKLDVRIGDIEARMSVHRFWRADRSITRNEMVVVSIFMTPMAGLVNDMALLQELGTMGRGASSLGVAQIQLVFDGNLSGEELHEKVNDFMSEMPEDLMRDMMSLPETMELDGLRNYTFDESGRS